MKELIYRNKKERKKKKKEIDKKNERIDIRE